MALPSRELAIPFRVDADGSIATNTAREEILIARVVSVLGTQPTERVMRPTYGCDIQRFAFDITDEIARADLTDAVQRALETWCPEARFIELEATDATQDGMVILTVRFSDATDPRDNRLEATLEFAVQGTGGEVTEAGI